MRNQTPRVAFLFLALVSIPIAAPAQFLFNYLTIGDSVTAGVCDTGNANCDPPFLGGYPSRLSAALACDGVVTCRVTNRSVAGLTTAAMITELNKPGFFDVVLILGGANDIIAGISADTIQFNYETMDNNAAARDMDPLLASMTRFRDDVATPAIDAAVADLRSRVMTMAAARNRYFADPWTPLCPTPTCFDTNYYQPSMALPPKAQETDPVGHPNSTGYDVLGDTFLSTVLTVPEPAPTTAVAPPSPSFDARPTLVWADVPTANWFLIELDGALLPEVWIERSESSCDGTTCAWTLSTPLAPGSHGFRVLGRNPAGASEFSGLVTFTVLDCALFPDLPLPPTTVTDTRTERACGKLTVTPGGYTVQAPGNVTLHAGDLIEIVELSVGPGAVFTAFTDPG